MRRERREILDRINQVQRDREVDRELGCGYTAADFGYEDPFDAELRLLEDRLAETYGMTGAEYFDHMMVISERLIATEDLPF